MRRAALLAALLGTGCAATAVAPAPSERFSAVESDPAVAAAAARMEAARSEEAGPGPLDALEVRIGGIGEGQTAPGGNFEVGARLNLTSPFEIAAQGRAAQAAVDEAAAVLDATALRTLVGRCDIDVAFAAGEARREIASKAASRLTELDGWVRGLGRANLLSAPALLELRMELGMARVAAAPASQAANTLPLFGLPDDRWSGMQWVATGAQLDALIDRYNPDLASRRAAGRRFEALAAQAGAAALPWVNFVEMDYQPYNDDEVRGDYAARFSVELPLSGEAGDAADGYRQRAKAESLDGEALRAELRLAAQEALATLAAYREREATWTELLAAAAEAEQVADSAIAARSGAADDLFSLARRAQEVRLRALSWQEEVAKAGCSLLAATGVRPEQFDASVGE